MVDVAIILLTGTESHADHGRLANGLEAAAEFATTEEDDLVFIFDGAGTQWIPKLEDPDSDYHELYKKIRNSAIVCDFCASAFEVDTAVDEADLPRADESDGHPSVRQLVAEGYEVITY